MEQGALPRWGRSEQMVGAAREECGGAALGAGLGPAPGIQGDALVSPAVGREMSGF